MECPLCDAKLEIVSSRVDVRNHSVVYNNRQCPECKTKFETTEKINYNKLNRFVLDRLHDRVDGRGTRKSAENLYA